MLPDIERINHLKFLTSESHQGEILKQFEEGVLRVEDYLKEPTPEGRNDQETPNSGGTSSSKDHVQVKTVKIIKVEEEKIEDIDIEKVGLTVMLAMSICVAVQWLFGNRRRRKSKVQKARV